MYAIVSSLHCLSEAMYFNLSLHESLLTFLRFNPNATSCLVFSDTRGRCRSGDLRFLCLYNKNKLNKLRSSLSPAATPPTRPDTAGPKPSL